MDSSFSMDKARIHCQTRGILYSKNFQSFLPEEVEQLLDSIG